MDVTDGGNSEGRRLLFISTGIQIVKLWLVARFRTIRNNSKDPANRRVNRFGSCHVRREK